MADFYGTPGSYTAYHTARGNVIPSKTDDQITAALLVSSEFLDARYRDIFGGIKIGYRAQIREWPRTGALDYQGYIIADDEIPVEVQNATFEVALRQLTTPGILSRDFTPVKYDQVSIDRGLFVIYTKYDSAIDVQLQMQIVDDIMSHLIGKNSFNASRLSGPTIRQ